MAKKRIPNEMEAVYVISVAASLSGMHPQTLRIYERRGLIEPFRTPGGTRRYSDADLELLGLIQDLTRQGINIEGVKRIMQLESENGCPTRRGPAAWSAVEGVGRGHGRLRCRTCSAPTGTEVLVRRDVMRLPDLPH